MKLLITEFERGMIAGACLFAAVISPFVATRYTEIENGKWVITGVCGFIFLVLLFVHSWIEAGKKIKHNAQD